MGTSFYIYELCLGLSLLLSCYLALPSAGNLLESAPNLRVKIGVEEIVIRIEVAELVLS